MRRVVFQIPFSADPSRIHQLVQVVNLESTRPDDWDTQLGFRLFGNEGAIRLFQASENLGRDATRYEMHGTAVSPSVVQDVATEFDRCMAAIRQIDGTVIDRGVVHPPGVELGDGRDDVTPGTV